MMFKTKLTPEALERFQSRNRANIYLTVIAMSQDLDEANSQLKRRGCRNTFRKAFLKKYGKYVNIPNMAGVPVIKEYVLDLL